MLKTIENVKVILVSPQDSRNVGAVCRAMKNMGLMSLRIVMKNLIDPKTAQILAVHAADILDNAEVFSDPAGAVKGASLVAGITRRRGKRRKYFSYSAEQAAEKIASIKEGWTALMFGNEASGLTEEELSLCNIAIRIPSSAVFPSLNLSHAVQIVTYEIFKAFNKEYNSYFKPVNGERLADLTDVIKKSLKRIGFFKITGEEDMGIFFRDIFARAEISAGEANRIEKVFRKIVGILTGKGMD